MADLGYSDFAGSGVVHLAGGICALVGAIILGPRLDRFNDDKSMYIAGHNIPHISLGGFILVAGFMAFNGGSQASIRDVIEFTLNNIYFSCGICHQSRIHPLL